MNVQLVTGEQKDQYDSLIHHIMQSWQWGEFRQSLGTPLLRYGLSEGNQLSQVFQLTLHKIPGLNYFVGYLPKGGFPDAKLAQVLTEIGKKHRCALIKIEPDIIKDTNLAVDSHFHPSPKSYFTPHNFILDLTQSEEEILNNMHQKTRYNIKVAQKHGVFIKEHTDEEGLKIHLKLYFDTCQRQNYHGHNEHYHRLVWETLRQKDMVRILIAYYQPEGSTKPTPLASWMLFNFKETLYYPYGGSSTEYKQVMAPTLLAWEAIKLGKKMGLKKFDLWGAAAPNTSESDPYFGFTNFKEKLGAKRVEYLGTFDLILNPLIYYPFTLIDKFNSLKFFLLKLLGK